MTVPQAPYPFLVVAPHLPVKDPERESCAEAERLTMALSPLVRLQQGAWIGAPRPVSTPVSSPRADGIAVVPVCLGAAATGFESLTAARLRPVYHGQAGGTSFGAPWWESYRAANARFAQQAIDAAGDEAVIWVHGFQLQLVPELIRRQRPDVRIGFFNDVPFPAMEVFAQLPWRADLIRGMLAADVLGFQLDSDAENFREASCSFTGIDPFDSEKVIRAYPESIDTRAFESLASSGPLRRRARELRNELGDPEALIASVDRLDCTTGLLNQLRAYEGLLEDGRIDPCRTSLVQFAVSSGDTEAGRQLREEAERLVGRINGRFASLHTSAVHYHCRTYSRQSLTALYAAADVFLVTSLREGMNLAAKEYVTARRERGGVLVLSEFAGAGAELEQAILINPHDGDGIEQAVIDALNMPETEARSRIETMAKFVADHDAHRWARSLLQDLAGAESFSRLP